MHKLLFPIDHPVMPEQRQIGRIPSIEALETQVNAAAHQWLIGPRRIGKTSVAKAVIARLRTQGVVALDIDISRLNISTPEGLAGEMARQAQAAGAGTRPRRRRQLSRISRQVSEAARFAKVLADFGFDDETKALEAVSALLASADSGEPGLSQILEALVLRAWTTDQRVVILLDEIQMLSTLAPDCDASVARWAREQECPIVFIFAGSEESAVRELRGKRKPLASVGVEFELPPISGEDWLHGLKARFKEAGVTVAKADLLAMIEASDCHPRRTMLIARNVHVAATAQPDSTATRTLVALAIRDAQQDRSWK
jgi:hypothetical protein